MLLLSSGARSVPRPRGCGRGGRGSPGRGGGGGLPTSVGGRPTAAQARPIHHPPRLRALPGRAAPSPPGLDAPPAHPALSVNFWVNSVSPPDLPFNPDKHESVNWASEGARGLLTHSAPSPAPHQTRAASPDGCHLSLHVYLGLPGAAPPRPPE